MTATFMKMT